jgi:hypothetical protein
VIIFEGKKDAKGIYEGKRTTVRGLPGRTALRR